MPPCAYLCVPTCVGGRKETTLASTASGNTPSTPSSALNPHPATEWTECAVGVMQGRFRLPRLAAFVSWASLERADAPSMPPAQLRRPCTAAATLKRPPAQGSYRKHPWLCLSQSQRHSGRYHKHGQTRILSGYSIERESRHEHTMLDSQVISHCLPYSALGYTQKTTESSS